MASCRIGNQKPRIRVEPKRVDSDGSDAAALVEAYGYKFDPWQRDVLDAWLGRDDNDKFSATSCGLSVPRQNGKNADLEGRELYGIVVIGEQILHTAHRVDTARKSFFRLLKFFENPANKDLKDLVSSIRKTNGQEAIFLKNGGSVEFSSRVNGGARGSTYDVVIFDEAQWLTDEQMESIMSTMAAAPLGNRQLIYTGTPPDPGSPGTIFGRQRKNALNKTDKSLAWHEWSVEEIGDVSDRNRWYDTNPGLGIRLDEDFTETELNTLSQEGFARERLGWWSGEEGANAALSKSKWLLGTVETPPEPNDKDKIAYGVKFTPDGAHVALSVAVKTPDQKTLVETIFYKLIVGGIQWLADWLIERKATCAIVVIDGKSNTSTLEQKLLAGGFSKKAIKITNHHEVAAAASMLNDAIEAEAIQHIQQPTLDESAVAAQKRLIGKDGEWGFGDGSSECAPIESVSFAYWGVMTTKRRPGRKSKLL